LSAAEIDVQLFAFNPVCHPTVILRRKLFAEHALRYSADAPHAEDLDLWMRAAAHFKLSNLPVLGLRYRVHARQVTNRFAREQHDTLEKLRRRQLLLLAPDASEADIALHLKAVDVSAPLTHQELGAIEEWLTRLKDLNSRSSRYDATAFHSFLVQRWLNASHRCIPRSTNVWRIWRRSEFANIGVTTSLWLLAKAVLQH